MPNFFFLVFVSLAMKRDASPWSAGVISVVSAPKKVSFLLSSRAGLRSTFFLLLNGSSSSCSSCWVTFYTLYLASLSTTGLVWVCFSLVTHFLTSYSWTSDCLTSDWLMECAKSRLFSSGGSIRQKLSNLSLADELYGSSVSISSSFWSSSFVSI